MLHSLLSSFIHLIFQGRGYIRNPFKNVPQKQLFREQLDSLPLPTIRYVIFFTPRSGSSRLTDLLVRAEGLGTPGECFNPIHIGKSAVFLGARSLKEYVNLLMRQRNTGGVFGCELTSWHLREVFHSHRRFFQLYDPSSCIFLIREDIVAQAVSLSRMAQTGIAHRLSDAKNARDDLNFQYLPRQIRRKIAYILSMETECEKTFAMRELRPLRLSYEELTSVSPEKFIPVIAEHIKANAVHIEKLQSDHQKLGTDKNQEYTQRFRSEHRQFVDHVESIRAETLRKLHQQKEQLFSGEQA